MDEFTALREVYDEPRQRWAIQQAAFFNAHFETKDAPWIADDFLGKSNRQQRINEALRNKAATMKENARLAKMRKGDIPDDIPDWAFGRKGRPDGRRCNRQR